MAYIKCEICGGSDLVKQAGLFVCQRCGAKYALEDARKLFVDDTVEQAGNSVEEIKDTVADLEDAIANDLSLMDDDPQEDEVIVAVHESQADPAQDASDSGTLFSRDEQDIVTAFAQQFRTSQSGSESDHPVLRMSVTEDKEQTVSPVVSSLIKNEEPKACYCAICHKQGYRDKELSMYDNQALLCWNCKQMVEYAKQSGLDRNAQRAFFIRQIKENHMSEEGRKLVSSVYNQSIEDFMRNEQKPEKVVAKGDEQRSEKVVNNTELSPYPMKWHNFQMVIMILGGILSVSNGMTQLSGMGHIGQGITPDQLSRYYPGMRGTDTFYGIILIALGIFEFIVRNRLNKFRENGPGSLKALYIVSIISDLIYAGLISSTRGVSLNSSSIIGSIGASVLFLIINSIYYSKRRSLFVN